MKNNRTGWLEDFDPTASASRTWTRQRLARARGLGPVHPGYYNGALQRGNTTGKQKGKQSGKIKNEKMSYLYFLNLFI